MIVHSMDTRLLTIPLGAARGGSGATAVEVVFVELKLQDGLNGTGFTFALTGGGKSLYAMLEHTFKDSIVGANLLDWDKIWLKLWDQTHRLGRGVAVPAISAIDIA